MALANDIFQQATLLSAKEKATLVDQLIATLDIPDPAIDELWAEEAESRLAAYHRGELQAVSLEEVLSKYQ
jgi:putative addiction module component (TIGR02574 family)